MNTKVITQKNLSVDIASGKEVTMLYFDPAALNDINDPLRNSDWAKENLYSAAQVVKDNGGTFSCKLVDDKIVKLQSGLCRKINAQDDIGVPDILILNEFSEMSFINTLRRRYYRDDIYTFVGPIVVSVNPYKSVKQIYTEEKMKEYFSTIGSTLSKEKAELQPHLYAVAQNAYNALIQSISTKGVLDQAIIISGESGAGKTESTKRILEYYAFITRMKSIPVESDNNVVEMPLEQRVLNVNPLLEAFGNAKTQRNDNSSRFGKVCTMHFIKLYF